MTSAGNAVTRRLAAIITIDLLRKRRYSGHPDYRRWEENELFSGLRKAGISER